MTKPDASSARLANAPRRGLSRVEAALYIGVGTTKFDEMVADGRMPGAKRIDGRKVWDLRALDVAFDELPADDNGPSSRTADHAAWMRGVQVFVRKPRSKIKGYLRTPIAVSDDPETLKVIEDLERQGVTQRYAPGEWEAAVRSRPMGKREHKALGEFYRAKDDTSVLTVHPTSNTAARLLARGFVTHADPNRKDGPCRITQDGEAAWLAILGERSNDA